MPTYFVVVAVFALFYSVGVSLGESAPAAPSPQAFYSEAVESMRALPQPQYVIYTMVGSGDNVTMRLEVSRHLVWIERFFGSGPSEWLIRHRTKDYASEIITDQGKRLVSTRAFFDPTWYGAFRALRDGMLMYQQIDPPVSASATPEPGASPDLRTIAVVTVMGSNIYSVEDRGVADCANGDAGHALHLVSREPDPRYQLADVVVDVNNMHFCTIRFDSTERGYTQTVEQHYDYVGGYWLQTGGEIEMGMNRDIIWHYQLQRMQFPVLIPAEAFLIPSDQ